jgi:carbamoyl-phosphate synthase large subunit
VETDAVCDGERVLIPGLMEHIERAGVHSGDSMAVYPGLGLKDSEVKTLIDYTVRIGLGLQVKGLMNIQFVILRESYESRVYVLEVNPRASRTIPFISKVTGVPMVRIATKVLAGVSLQEQRYETGLWKSRQLVGIKAPVFSMWKLAGVDTYLGPEMKSTGEVMGVDYTFEAALTKALMAAGLMLPPRGTLLLSIADRDKPEAMNTIRRLASIGYRLFATEGTAVTLRKEKLPVQLITKKLTEGHPNVLDVIRDGSIDGVVNTITGERTPLRDGFAIRRAAVEKRIPCFTSLDTFRVAVEALAGGDRLFNIQPLREYLRRKNHR